MEIFGTCAKCAHCIIRQAPDGGIDAVPTCRAGRDLSSLIRWEINAHPAAGEFSQYADLSMSEAEEPSEELVLSEEDMQAVNDEAGYSTRAVESACGDWTLIPESQSHTDWKQSVQDLFDSKSWRGTWGGKRFYSFRDVVSDVLARVGCDGWTQKSTERIPPESDPLSDENLPDTLRLEFSQLEGFLPDWERGFTESY